MKSGILFLLSILFSATVWSQSNEDRLQRLLEDDPESLNIIIAADADVQAAVLEATTYPDILSKIQTIQDRSRAAFDAIVSPYSQETQQIFWDLSRYPNLIARLAREGKGSDIGAQEVLRNYPEAIHARAKEANKYYYSLLVKIADLERQTNQDFDDVLDGYPRHAQDIFRKLLERPEALSALTQSRSTTDQLGNLYKSDPNWTLRRFNELNQDLQNRNEQELQDWRSSIESDPEAAQELTQSAQAYAQEYGYDDEYYGEDFDDDDYYRYRDNRQRIVVREYYYYHYPYWFGYPRWYRAPRWRPVPVWYDYGFVWRPNRPVVIIQMPSFYFVNWYFYRPWHHYRYARLSNCFVDYYYRHPRSYNSIVININTWKYRNRAVIHDDWLRDRDHRTERLREFGQFEEERRNYNRDHRNQAISQRDYLDKSDSKYERLRQVAPRNADRNTFPERDRTVETPRRPEATTAPRTRTDAQRQTPERTVEPREERRTAPTEQPRTRTREEVQPRETPKRVPERTDTQQQRRKENPPSTKERTWEPQPERRAPDRSNSENTRERSMERPPNREPQTRTTPERTRTPEVERSRTPQRETQRSVERPRTNNSQERSKSAPKKQEESTRKRSGSNNQ